MPSSSFSSLEKLDKPNKLTHNPVVAYQKLVQEIAYGVWPNKPIVKPYNVYHRPFEFLTTSGQRSAAAAAAAYHILFQLLPPIDPHRSLLYCLRCAAALRVPLREADRSPPSAQSSFSH